jgi:hypothetical protein
MNAAHLVHSIRYDYAVPVTTAAYVEISSSLPKNCRFVEIFDSSGSTMELAYGPAGSEVKAINIIPGGNELRPLILNAGMRLSLKAISANATAGECTINFFY